MRSRHSATVPRASMRSSWTRAQVAKRQANVGVPGRGSRSTRKIACTVRHATLRIRRRISPGSRPKGAVAPITRICRRRMRRLLPLIALLLAGCANQPQMQAMSNNDDRASQAFSTYLSARFAANEHDLGQAARYYGQALSDDPGNPSLLAMSFFYSTTSGDFEAAGKYAQAVVTATPDDRAARLALAVIAFRHKDYADVRKQLSQSAKGPFTALTLALFDAWAAAAQHDTQGVQKDIQILAGQKGAEGMAAFHAALIEDYLGDAAAADAAYKKALGAGAPTPRIMEAYGRF